MKNTFMGTAMKFGGIAIFVYMTLWEFVQPSLKKDCLFGHFFPGRNLLTFGPVILLALVLASVAVFIKK